MAEKVIITDYPDGSRVMSNIRNSKGVPVFGKNETYTATKVSNWYNGDRMTPNKADGLIYMRQKGTGDYYKVNLPNDKELFLEKDTMAQLRDMSSTEILLLKMGYYKGVRLNGYYSKEDTPAPIEYYISNTLEADDGGSVIEVGGLKFEHKFTSEAHIKHFGAKGDNNRDDTDFIQRTFDYCSKVNVLARIDEGEFKHTKPLVIRDELSIKGYGQNSILRPNSCDCLDIKSSNGILPRFIGDFHIYGHGGDEFIAIKSSITTGRATGINFQRISTSFIGQAFDLRNIWHSIIDSCYFICSKGVTLSASCVKIIVKNTTIIHNTAMVNNLERRGISVMLGNGTRPEDISIQNNLIYGFDIPVFLETVLFCNIMNNDLDYCKVKGIHVQQADSVLNIANNWIAQWVEDSTLAPFTGIDLITLQSINNSAKNITGNTINGSSIGGNGVFVGSGQIRTSVKGNTINNFVGVYIDSESVNVMENTINSEDRSIFIGVSKYVVIDSNNIIKGFIGTIPNLANNGITWGQNNNGIVSTGFKRKITLPANQTSAVGLLASINVGLILDNPTRIKAILKHYEPSDKEFDFGAVTLVVTGDAFNFTVQNPSTQESFFYLDVECVSF